MADSLPFSPPVQEALADAKSALEEIYGDRLKRLIVYGSQARGEARPDSDVDLMIVLGGKVRPDEEAQRTSRLVIRLASEYGVALSPLHLSEENFERDRPLPRAARREGVVL
jgi:predicted nucleotidyltransferase